MRTLEADYVVVGAGAMGRPSSTASWLQASRLDRSTALLSEAAADPTPKKTAAFKRWRASIPPGLESLAHLLMTDPAPATQGAPI